MYFLLIPECLSMIALASRASSTLYANLHTSYSILGNSPAISLTGLFVTPESLFSLLSAVASSSDFASTSKLFSLFMLV